MQATVNNIRIFICIIYIVYAFKRESDIFSFCILLRLEWRGYLVKYPSVVCGFWYQSQEDPPLRPGDCEL